MVRRRFLAWCINGTVIVTMVGAAIGIATQSPPVDAAVASGWSGPTDIDSNALTSVSCPTVSFCMAVDDDGNAVEYDGASWSSLSNIDINALSSVSCTSSSFCVAVDNQGNALTFDGSSWSVPDDIDGYQNIINVSCVSSSFCEAVDLSGDTLSYDGTSWSRSSSDLGGEHTVLALSCVSESFCMAIGQYDNSYTFNGTSWSSAIGDDLGNTSYKPVTFSCVSTTFCMAGNDDVGGGNDITEEFNGTSWQEVTEGTEVASISCASPGLCVGVGQDVFEDWSGASWSASQVIDTDDEGDEFEVSCASINFCVAISGDGDVYVFDGLQAAPDAQAELYAAESRGDASDSSDTLCGCYVAGPVNTESGDLYDTATDINIPGQGFNLNVTRTYNSMAEEPATNTAINSTYCVSSTDCWAVGEYEYQRAPTTWLPLIEQWNGTSWSIDSVPYTGTNLTEDYLETVTCISSSECWAAGFNNGAGTSLYYNYDGSSWSAVSSPDGENNDTRIYGISCVSSSDCWSVGTETTRIDDTNYTYPVVETWNGSEWSIGTAAVEEADETNELYSVSCISSSDCWTMGIYDDGSDDAPYQPFAEQWNGTDWSTVSVPTTDDSGDSTTVSCVSSSDCWGTYGITLEEWNGTDWSSPGTVTTPEDTSAYQVLGTSCTSSSSCFVVGDYFNFGDDDYDSLIDQYNGSEWSVDSAPDPGSSITQLNSVSCTSDSSCVAVGLAGVGECGGGADPCQPVSAVWDGSAWSEPSDDMVDPEVPILGPFGYGWTANFTMNFVEDPLGNQITIYDESDSPVTFTLDDGTWTAPAFNASTLVKDPVSRSDCYVSGHTTWQYTRWDGDTFCFNSSGELTSEEDRNGDTTTFTYSGSELTEMQDASGRDLTFTWGTSAGGYINVITEITDPDDQTVQYAYDYAGDLDEVTNQAGDHTYYSYDDSLDDSDYMNHDLLTIEDPNSNTVETNTYNADGQVVSQEDGLDNETTLSYSTPAPNVSTTLVTDPNGDETLYTYDYGLLVQKTAAYGTDLAATTNYTYDPSTLGMTSETDPNGNTTTYTYDDNGNVLTETDPLGDETTNTYNDLNELLTSEDPDGNWTTNTYDSDGNLCWTKITTSEIEDPTCDSPPSGATVYTYGDDDYPGLPTAVEDPDGNTTTMTYDSYGDLASSTNAVGDETTYTYDILGRELTEVSPKGNVADCDCSSDYTTTWTYNALNEPLTETNPLGDETTYTYDDDGNLLTTEDPEGNKTLDTYNADNEVTEVQDKNSGGTVVETTHTGYDDDGDVTSQTDGNGNETTYTYNALNEQTSMTTPGGQETTYTYDGDGNLLTTTEPDGDVVTNTYNAGDQLTGTSYSDDATPSVSYTYDDDGNVLTMTDGTGTSTWTYNDLGEVTSYENGNGQTVGYGYDDDGNETSITYPGDLEVTQGYNDANEMTSVTDWNDNENTFTYDADGNLTGEDLANGVTNSYSYDDADDLTGIDDTNADSDSVFSASYTLNDDGLVSEDSSQPDTADEYQYTALNQVCYAASSNSDACDSAPDGSTAYAYDDAGNLISDDGTTQSFNSDDELCWSISGSSDNSCGDAPDGATTYTYNDNGDRTATTPAEGSATAYSYNGANEMTEFQLGDYTPTSYAYDGMGMLQSETTGDSSTEFTWSGTGSTQELLQQTNGDETTSYIYGPTGEPLEEILPGGDTYWYSQDDLGSTRALTDSSGDVEDTDTYDPYGNLTADTGSVANSLLYDGQYLDSASGLYYLRARWYDPTTAQFTTVDPDVAATRSPFAYAVDNPVNRTDPTGKNASGQGNIEGGAGFYEWYYSSASGTFYLGVTGEGGYFSLSVSAYTGAYEWTYTAWSGEVMQYNVRIGSGQNSFNAIIGSTAIGGGTLNLRDYGSDIPFTAKFESEGTVWVFFTATISYGIQGQIKNPLDFVTSALSSTRHSSCPLITV